MANFDFFNIAMERRLSRKGFAPVIVFCVAALIVISGVIGYLALHKNFQSGPVACTIEARLCPDGSAVGRSGPNCEFAACPPSNQVPASSSVPIDMVNWNLYSSNEFGFSFKYPSTWQKSGDMLSVANPHVFFGNPLTGVTTYALKVSVFDDPQNLSAEDFVRHMLADSAAYDASANAQGPAPQTTPQFAKQYAVTVGSSSGYELYGVFEYDHRGEQVYVQQKQYKQMMMFDFPVADANPNIANPVANNAIAHQIVGTLQLDSAVLKFCGGIAAFPCPAGFACKLDGNFPDAGGHCVKR